MNREEARKYIISNAKSKLTPDKSGRGFICPICGSGSGKNGTGITTKDGIHFTCWAGCFSNADYIDIVGVKNGVDEKDKDRYNKSLYAAADEFNITIDSGYQAKPENQNRPKNEQYAQDGIHNDVNTIKQEEQEPEAEPDYTSFFLQANKDIGRTDYHRGLSLETLNRFKVGYVAEWKHPKLPNDPVSPRLIIPTSKHSYLARDTRSILTPKQEEDKKMKVGKVRIFNNRALREATNPIFIVEGEIDALSIIDVGGEAVGLGSMNYTRIFLNLIEAQKPTQPLIIALDNETDQGKREKVERAVKKLTDGLEKCGVSYYKIGITGQYKDANEALTADREAFRVAVNQAVEQVKTREAEEVEEEREQIKREAVAYSLQDFIRNIENSKKNAYIPTGFSNLDSILDGGLYAGLYIVGAISSLGKTTFCLQVADQIAQGGQDVLIFSLEMARDELIAKSVSRLTIMEDLSRNGSTANAKTTRGILTGSRYEKYNARERELIQSSITAYSQYARNIYITEGIGNVGVAQIRNKVEKHIKLTGKAPVVVIDYLQIIAPADVRATDKQNTDKAVLELKRMSRDYSIPVIGISSFNRDNYTSPVNVASFKESGAIEYSSDVLIGLQYQGMDYKAGEADKTREKRIRKLTKEAVEIAKKGGKQKIQVKILKNRNGSKGEALLDFYPMFNYFCVSADDESGEDIEEQYSEYDEWDTAESSYK